MYNKKIHVIQVYRKKSYAGMIILGAIIIYITGMGSPHPFHMLQKFLSILSCYHDVLKAQIQAYCQGTIVLLSLVAIGL